MANTSDDVLKRASIDQKQAFAPRTIRLIDNGTSPRGSRKLPKRAIHAACLLFGLVRSFDAAASGRTLVHAEDFSTASLYDHNFWEAETGFFRNKEAQYYRPENIRVTGAVICRQLLNSRLRVRTDRPTRNAGFVVSCLRNT